MIVRIYTICLIILITNIGCKKENDASTKYVEWSRNFGGSEADVAVSATETKDGGFLVAGYTYSSDRDVSGQHCVTYMALGGSSFNTICGSDAWIVRVTAHGNMVSQSVYGSTPTIPSKTNMGQGGNSDRAASIIPASNALFVIVGTSNKAQQSASESPSKVWLFPVNENGVLAGNEKRVGEDLPSSRFVNEIANAVITGSDGNYFLAGESNDSSALGYHIGYTFPFRKLIPDALFLKTSSSGDIIWKKAFGGSDVDKANAIIQAYDGGYVMVGQTHSTDGDAVGNHGSSDLFIVKTDLSGQLLKAKVFGGGADDIANAIIKTSDSGYIIAGQTSSTDGDVKGNHGGNFDAWIIKLDAGLNVKWQKTYGGSFGDDVAKSIVATDDGGSVFVGQTNSNDGDVSGNHGYTDAWVVKIDNMGRVVWQQTIGGSGIDYANHVLKTSDGGLLISGGSSSNDGDVSQSRGISGDFWVVKLRRQ